MSANEHNSENTLRTSTGDGTEHLFCEKSSRLLCCVLDTPFLAAMLKTGYALVSDFNRTLEQMEEEVANQILSRNAHSYGMK